MDVGGDMPACQSVAVTAAVPPFVVMQADVTENIVVGVLPQGGDGAKQPDTQRGVLLQDPALLQHQLSALLED